MTDLSRFSLLTIAAAVACCGVLLSCERSKKKVGQRESEPDPVRVVKTMVATEELILELGPRLRPLATSLTESGSRDALENLLAGEVTVRGVPQEPSQPGLKLTGLGAEIRDWPISGGATTVAAEQFVPGLLFGSAFPGKFTQARFAIVRGTFGDDGRERFTTTISFEGKIVTQDGRLLAVESEQEVGWSRRDGTGWRIVSFELTRLRTVESRQDLFAEVLDVVVPDVAARKRLRESLHRRILVDSYFGGKPAALPGGYSDSRFFPDSVNVHPALSVVDIDRDGWDDLYVCVRWGKNLLLRNRGDGTFEEIAAKVGLAIDGRNTSATFADFDNDGDPDLMLGRSLEKSLYLENVEGRFVNRPDAAGSPGLPWLVTSTSAADYNGDGLLDVYLSTYSPLDINTRVTGAAAGQAPEWARKFLPPQQAGEVVRRSKEAHDYLAQVGPPNVLFVNRGGGRFEVAPESEALSVYRNTFQAAWADIDADGDPDLYVVNDFAPDHFYRNDGGKGFTDVTREVGFDGMGFGMGASWGDFDNDGREDLYVSNMYSKAGRRITGQVTGIDRRIKEIAAGNYLYRNGGPEGFQRVSDQGSLNTVARAGWSWGGQFADFDNDGFLDLYVSSGFYTPPANQDIGVDL